MFRKSLTISMGLLLSLSLMTLFGGFQEERPILTELVFDIIPNEAEEYNFYIACEKENPQSASTAVSRVIRIQADEERERLVFGINSSEERESRQ